MVGTVIIACLAFFSVMLALHLPNPLRWLDETTPPPPRSTAFSLLSLGFVCGLILKNYLKASFKQDARNTVFLARSKKELLQMFPSSISLASTLIVKQVEKKTTMETSYGIYFILCEKRKYK